MKNVGDSICYTGVGALKKKNHTKKEYLGVMKKNFRKKCKEFVQAKKCKPCKTYKKMLQKNIIEHLAAFKKKKKKYNMTKKQHTRFAKVQNQCRVCKTKRRKDCDLEEDLEYSGAVKGRC